VSTTLTSVGAYSYNLAKIHPQKNLHTLAEPTSRKHWLSDLSNLDSSFSQLDISGIGEIFLPSYNSSDPESESEGFDRKIQDFCSEEESDEHSQQLDATTAGIPLREYSFQVRDSGFNLCAPFCHAVDYRLARFFNAEKTSKQKIDLFFKNGILKDLNPTHEIQFRLANTLHKLFNEAANEPDWHMGKVDYPLLKGVPFRYCNIISRVKYLLRQKIYATDMVWGLRRECDNQGNRIYSYINTGTW